MSTSTVTEHTVHGYVTSLDQLRDRDRNFLSGTVNVVGDVNLPGLDLERFPVRFGTVSGYFICGENRLISLEGAPSTVGGGFYCSWNRLTSLVGVHRILRRMDGTLYINRNPIVAGGIGLILVEGLTEIYADHPALRIVEQHLGQGMKGVLRCQEALHEAGYGEHARL